MTGPLFGTSATFSGTVAAGTINTPTNLAQSQLNLNVNASVLPSSFPLLWEGSSIGYGWNSQGDVYVSASVAGSGYTGVGTVTFSGGTCTTLPTATAYVMPSGGLAFALTSAGSCTYGSAPTVSISGFNTGSGASLTVSTYPNPYPSPWTLRVTTLPAMNGRVSSYTNDSVSGSTVYDVLGRYTIDGIAAFCSQTTSPVTIALLEQYRQQINNLIRTGTSGVDYDWLVDLGANIQDYNNTYIYSTADQVHPNGSGQIVLAQIMDAALRASGLPNSLGSPQPVTGDQFLYGLSVSGNAQNYQTNGWTIGETGNTEYETIIGNTSGSSGQNGYLLRTCDASTVYCNTVFEVGSTGVMYIPQGLAIAGTNTQNGANQTAYGFSGGTFYTTIDGPSSGTRVATITRLCDSAGANCVNMLSSDSSGNITVPYSFTAGSTITGNTITTPSAWIGAFTCTAGGTVSVTNSNVDSTSDITITLKTAGGTISTPPAFNTLTAGTGFSVLCGASDTSTYRYHVWN